MQILFGYFSKFDYTSGSISFNLIFDVYFNIFLSLANMTLPAEGEDSPFKEILFVDLQREEAQKLVDQYNKVRFNLYTPMICKLHVT